MEEHNLIKLIKNGDKEAFEKMFKKYVPKLKNFLTRMCNNPTLAEDMLQETMLKVHQNIKKFKEKSKLSTWLFQIAANNCKMFKRKKSSREEHLTPIYEGFDCDNSTHEIENRTVLNSLLMKIPIIYRSAIILSDLEGFTANEIAKIFKISLQNAKIRILRGRKMLSNLAKEDGKNNGKH